MSNFKQEKQKEVDNNFSAINKLIKEQKIPLEMYGKYALMKDTQIKGYYSTWDDAYQAGLLKYEDKLFSIQQVTTSIVDLGYYSRALA